MSYLKLLFDLYRLKRNTKKTLAQIRANQEKKLRKMLKYAYDNSKYYRRIFEQAGITKENIQSTPLRNFPSTDKNGLMKNFDEIITVSDLTQEELRRFDEEETVDRRPFKGKYHVVHSSGSTGKPGYFIYDKKAWESMLTGIIRAALWDMSMMQILKLLAGGPRIVYIAATDGRYGGAMAVGDGIDGVGAESMYLDIKTPLDEWGSRIQSFKPNMIIGYPSAVKILGELIEKSGLKLDVFRVVSCGEPLGASLRRYLEKTFNAKVINFYGASESLSLGVEGDPADKMVLFDDMNVIEVQDGNVYLTSLYNFAQPLIRYRLTDSLVLRNAEEYGRYPFTRADGLIGRNEDILWFKNKAGRREFIHPLAVEGICVEGLKDYQFRQTGEDTFEMLAEAGQNTSRTEIQKRVLEQMKKILDEKELGFVQFYVRFTDKILPNPRTGKKSLIVKEEKEAIADEGEGMEAAG